MNGGAVGSKTQPSATKQSVGFAPTYTDATGRVVLGDPLDVSELNFIFHDLYAQADNIDQILTAKGK